MMGMDKIGGVMLVWVMALLLFQGASWQLDLEPLDLFASYDLLRAYNLVAVADDGTVVISDVEGSRCHILSPSGKAIGQFGGKGDGPGEFRGIILPFWAADSFWILEDGNQRISRWSKRGELLETVKLAHNVEEGILLGDQSLLTTTDSSGRVGSQPGVANFHMKDGDKRLLWQWEALPVSSGNHKDGASITTVWDPSLKIAGHDNLVAAIYTSIKQVVLIDRKNASLVRKIHLPIPAVVLTQQAYELFLDELPTEVRARVRQKVTRPSYWPTVNKISMDGQHRIWVSSYQKNRTSKTPLYVFSSLGKKLMQTSIPGVFQTQKSNAAYSIEVVDDHLRLVKTVIPFKF